MTLNNMAQDHFSLFGLPSAYVLDAVALERAYRDIQARIHPDKFVNAGEAEKRASMQWTTRVNEAYRTLKDPVLRAKYLLEQAGHDVGFETNTAMAPAFLMRQMELRESLEEARDAAALDKLSAQLAKDRQRLEAILAAKIDAEKDPVAAVAVVRELQFLSRFGEEIGAAYVALDE
jgi:molecular chaperone HscB